MEHCLQAVMSWRDVVTLGWCALEEFCILALRGSRTLSAVGCIWKILLVKDWTLGGKNGAKEGGLG